MTADEPPLALDLGVRAVRAEPRAAVTSLSTLEVRWIRPGEVPSAMTEWFAGFPLMTEVREDSYLIHPEIQALSVKIRGLTHVELKLGQKAARTLHIRGVGMVDVVSCEKWSFHLGATHVGTLDGEWWKRVKKTRVISRFSGAGEPLEPGSAMGDSDSRCAVELTNVEVDGKAWWTIALEAIGSSRCSHDALEATARVVFGAPLPAVGRLRASETRPYSEWLGSLRKRFLASGTSAESVRRPVLRP